MINYRYGQYQSAIASPDSIVGIIYKIQSIVQKRRRDRIPICESSTQQGLYDLRGRRDDFKGENSIDSLSYLKVLTSFR